MGCNREKPGSLTWLPVCRKSQSLLAETICRPSAAKGCHDSALSSSWFARFCQVIEKVRQICDENQQSGEREKRLQEELSSRLSKEKEVSADIEALKKSLRELQVSPLNTDDQAAARR